MAYIPVYTILPFKYSLPIAPYIFNSQERHIPKDDEAVGEPSGLVLSCAVVEALLLLLLAVDSAVLDVEA